MTIGQLWRQLLRFINRDRAIRELEEEMRLHVALRAESLRKRGHEPGDAQFAAQRRFGNTTVIQQRSRDMWGFANLDSLRSDVRFAVRRLQQRKAFSLAVIGALALGIGSATAMFSAVDAAMLRPLPFREPSELVSLLLLRPDRLQIGNAPPSGPHVLNVADAMSMTDLFSDVAVYASGGLNLADADHPLRLKAGVVSANFFRTLGVAPIVGRAFDASEGRPGGADVALLSYGLWQRAFGGRNIAGLKITLSSRSYDVVGVMPGSFSFPEQSDVWLPLTVPTTAVTYEAFDSYLPVTTIARLAPNLTVASARARLLTRWEQSVAAMPREPGRKYNFDNTLSTVREKGSLKPLQQQLLGDRKTALFVLLGATGCLLLIACANVMNLLLSQSAMRQRELAVREVLGATRGRLIRQLLTECIVLSTLGAAIGVALAPLALLFISALLPVQLGGIAPATVSARVLTFASLLSVITAIAFGLWPAIGGTRNAPVTSIKAGGGHGATAARAGRLRRLLVGAELALTLVLLVGAGLMLRSFSRLMGEDSGIVAANVGTLRLTMPRAGDLEEKRVSARLMLSRIRETPGVADVGMVNDLPLATANGMGLSVVADGEQPKGRPMRFSRYLQATGGYFNVMGIRLHRGRVFTERDTRDAPKVAVINESMAKAYWPGVDALGRTFKFDKTDSASFTVVGIVADVREDNLDKEPGAQMYFSIYVDMPHSIAVVARGAGSSSALLAAMVQGVHSVNASQAVFNVRMMNDVIGSHVAPRRTNTILIGTFAIIALLLAALGVYAVVSHSVVQRSREFGIRAALGATSSNLVGLVAREMTWVTCASVLVGIAGAWVLARVVQGMVYGVDVHDPITFAVVPVALLVPTLVATVVPALRASRVNLAGLIKAE